MAAEKPLLDAGGIVLTNATATLFAPPVGPGNITAVITSMLFVNNDNAARTVTLYRVPPGGSAAQATMIFPATSIAANTVWGSKLRISVPQGWEIQGKASVNSVVTWSPDGVLYE